MRTYLAAVAAATFCAIESVNASYTFTSYVETTSRFVTFDEPSINNDGTVAYVRDDLTVPRTGVYTVARGGQQVAVATSDEGFTSFAPLVSLTNAGTVVFNANTAAASGSIYARQKGATRTLVGAGNLSNGTINDPAFTAYRANAAPNRNGVFIKRVDGSAPAVLRTDPAGPYTVFSAFPVGNEAGTIATLARTADGAESIVSAAPGGGVQVVADRSGPLNDFGDIISINPTGTVAFIAQRDGGGDGVYAARAGGPLITIADSSGPLGGFSDPAITAAGTVVFMAAIDTGGGGLFTGPDPVRDAVIRDGDALFGSRVAGTLFYPEGVSDNGEIAFIYLLNNGATGIAVATPVAAPIPEPTSLGLLAFSAGGLLARRRRAMV